MPRSKPRELPHPRREPFQQPIQVSLRLRDGALHRQAAPGGAQALRPPTTPLVPVLTMHPESPALMPATRNQLGAFFLAGSENTTAKATRNCPSGPRQTTGVLNDVVRRHPGGAARQGGVGDPQPAACPQRAGQCHHGGVGVRRQCHGRRCGMISRVIVPAKDVVDEALRVAEVIASKSKPAPMPRRP